MIIKVFLLLISFFQLFSLSSLSGIKSPYNSVKNEISNANELDTENKHFEPNNSESVIYLLNDEKVYFTLDEAIILSYENITDIKYNILTEGCSLIKETHDPDEKTIKINLNYTAQTANFEMKTSNDAYFKMYFIKSGDRVFRSSDSLESARRNLYGTLLDEGKITEKEYTQFIRLYSQPSIIPTSQQYRASKASTAGLLYGTFSYQDDYGKVIPIRFTKVEILDEDINFDDTLGVVYTDENGYFEFKLNKTTENIFGNGYDIYIKLYAKGSNTQVVDESNHLYCYISDVNKDIPKDFSKDFSACFSMSDNDIKPKFAMGKYFSISQASIMSARFANYLNNGYDITECTIHYPLEDKTCYYASDHIYLKVPTKDEEKELKKDPNYYFYPKVHAAWDVICHEYGHHVQSCFDILPATTLKDHSIIDSIYDLENYIDENGVKYDQKLCRIDGVKLAYLEGWATIFGLFAQKYNGSYLEGIRFIGDNYYTADNLIHINFGDYSIIKGECCEGSIGQIMFHLWDTDNDDMDQFTISYKDWFYLSTYGNPVTLAEFIGNCYDFGIDKFALGKLLNKYNICANYIWLKEGNYLDEVPTFVWSVNGEMKMPNNSFDLVFTTTQNVEILRVNNIHYSSYPRASYTLTKEQWSRILASVGNGYYVYVISRCDTYITTGPYYSEKFYFAKPSDFRNKIQIKASEWGFESQYFFETNKEGHDTTTFSKNGLTITTKRLRCGYIEDSYVILSPRRQNAGEAYLELYFDKPVYSYLFGITLWSKNEGIDDNYTARIEEMDSDGNWHISWDLMNDLPNGFSTKDQQVDRYESICSDGIYGLRFVVTSPAIGDRNKGRLCIEDIVLNTDPNDLKFITKYY